MRTLVLFVLTGLLPVLTFAAEWNINFQPQRSAAPDGFLIDSGAAYGDRGNGFVYGWNGPTGKRDNSEDSAVPSVEDTLVLARGGTWEFELPNGVYQVAATVGDAVRPQHAQSMLLEGHYLADLDPLADQVTLASTVSVSDGKLTLSPALDAQRLAIAALKITSVAEHLPATDGQVHGLLGT
jgi:hypothetical protein